MSCSPRDFPSTHPLLQRCARLTPPRRVRETRRSFFANRIRCDSIDRDASVDDEGSPDAWLNRAVARRQETPWVDGIRCRCPPAEQRAPFVCGCTPEVSGPSHETGRVRLLTQRTALTTACADAAHRWFSFLSSRRPAWPSAPWSLPCPVTRACPKAGRPRFGFPCDGSHASRPSSRHALLTVVSGMPWQSRSSRLQRGSPR